MRQSRTARLREIFQKITEETMRRKSKLLAFLLSAALVLGTVSGLVGCVTDDGPTVEKPDPVYKVYSVTLRYNDANVDGGTINVDLSAGSIQLGANVRKDEAADGTVTYSSSDPAIATIDATGKVTLLAEGETVITASAGGKSHQVVLVVSDDYQTSESHTITVNGGTASATSAKAGDYVTLSATIPAHMDFIEWQFDGEDTIWTNGNVFRMPDRDIVITADFDEMLYTLNVVGASVSKADEVTDPEGEDGGNTEGGTSADFDMTVYKFSYETEISLEAIEAPEGKMFIGWDYGTVNNRVGETGDPEYGPFAMPDSTLTVWAVFSDLQTKVLTGSAPFSAQNITDGGGDPDLEGLSGYRLSIPATQRAEAGYPENIQGSEFSTLGQSKTLKAIFKNHHETLSVTVELYITFYGNVVSTGNVTVAPGETVTAFFPAGLGIDDPWWGMAVRENVGGTAGDGNIQLDMVLGCADTYPSGDINLSVDGTPEYVQLVTEGENEGYLDYNLAVPKVSGKFKVNNSIGYSVVAGSNAVFTNTAHYVASEIANMPEYNSNTAYTDVYVRVINNIPDEATYSIGIGTQADPNEDTSIIKQQVVIGNHQSVVIKLQIPRSADIVKYYFSVQKTGAFSTPTNLSIQLVFNNVFGYVEEE